uniref:Putative ovule protein n=1 Tax=Solanum chacoense TaxID=4108 RepID=A0A0V0HBH0_SOLCH
MPSKHLLFLSVRTPNNASRDHLPYFPDGVSTFHEFQLTRASLMLSGITHSRPKAEKSMFHMPVTAVQ